MEQSKVYFTTFKATEHENLLQKLHRLMKTAGFEQIDFTDKYAAIKIHFGEYGNLAFLRPNYAKVVADYVKETNHHVLYRVTPIFNSSNLVASGVLMEAKSVEDNEVEFCVYCYNVQPGIEIDYATGDSHESDSSTAQASPDNNNSTAVSDTQTSTYVINENTKKFHRPDCASVTQMNGNNKREYTGTRQELLDEGYSACKSCNP